MCSTQWRSLFIQLNETYPTVRKLQSGVLAQAKRITEDKVTAELRIVWEESDKLPSSVTDLKARSMRDNCNLVFAGITEDNREDTEAVLQQFLQLKYKQLDYEIPFELVHKTGRWNEFNKLPRNIVAKFTFFKDRKFMRTPAALKAVRVTIMGEWTVPTRNRRKKKKIVPYHETS